MNVIDTIFKYRKKHSSSTLEHTSIWQLRNEFWAPCRNQSRYRDFRKRNQQPKKLKQWCWLGTYNKKNHFIFINEIIFLAVLRGLRDLNSIKTNGRVHTRARGYLQLLDDSWIVTRRVNLHKYHCICQMATKSSSRRKMKSRHGILICELFAMNAYILLCRLLLYRWPLLAHTKLLNKRTNIICTNSFLSARTFRVARSHLSCSSVAICFVYLLAAVNLALNKLQWAFYGHFNTLLTAINSSTLTVSSSFIKIENFSKCCMFLTRALPNMTPSILLQMQSVAVR